MSNREAETNNDVTPVISNRVSWEGNPDQNSECSGHGGGDQAGDETAPSYSHAYEAGRGA